MTPLEKKQQLADELNRLADVIDALSRENARLRWIVGALVEEVESDERVVYCFVNYDKPSIQLVRKQEDR